MSQTPHETELKLVLAPGEAGRLARAAPLAGLASRRENLVAVYVDTPQLELAGRGLGLRLRKAGRHWRATLKADSTTAGGLHSRPEWEYPVPGPVLDLSRFAGTPLADLADPATLHERLVPVLTTEFRRTRWVYSPAPGSRLEVVLDEGHLFAGKRSAPISEVEIEVLEGPPSAAFDLAEQLAGTLALRPEPASKLARGFALAGPAKPRPARARPVDIADAPDAREAARRIVASCLAQAQANEEGVLASPDIEYVHQLRVALRRLRSALRLFRDTLAPGEGAAFAEDLRWAAAALGRCRDWDVFATETLPPLLAAQGDATVARAIRAGARARQREARQQTREAILSARYGRLMIRLARWCATHAPAPPGVPAPKAFASASLRKGARRIRAGQAGFSRATPDARHQLRIHVKRQRYAVEFLGSLFRGQAPARHARRLAHAQESLGLANDSANALAHVAELAPGARLLEFARGWFAAHESVGVAAAARDLARAVGLRRFWRRKSRAPAPGGTPPLI